MACRPPGSGSYTVVIIPLRTSLYSLDALRFYLWVKRLKDLEQEKDALCSGLEILEKARLWYLQRLEENRARQENIETKSKLSSCQEGAAEAQSCLLRSRIQRVNGSLGSVMSEPYVTSCSNPSLPDAVADSDLRWHNTVLTQEVSDKNRQISKLEWEKDALLEQLDQLQAH
ncbi:suppressor APC domain-containing protein 1 [Plectropomus leopardus]|uniref:suppressor APC domain-containing protein 1 n=1 Tax=Plectropomus leopardus TaxID=160734 RepID=UPI001C4DAB2E|nr:suppressor APC domain-containing protein 1 [Plectropomus leopardus]